MLVTKVVEVRLVITRSIPDQRPTPLFVLTPIARHSSLKKGDGCLGDTTTGPLRASFDEGCDGLFHDVVWRPK